MTVSAREAVASTRLVIGETVHYRDAGRCWAAAIVDAGPGETAQLYVFPLPPAMPMPASPGTFLGHDGATTDDTWHRLTECRDGFPEEALRPSRRATRRRGRGSAA